MRGFLGSEFFLVEEFARVEVRSEGVEDLLVLVIASCCGEAKVLRVNRIVKVQQHDVPWTVSRAYTTGGRFENTVKVGH